MVQDFPENRFFLLRQMNMMQLRRNNYRIVGFLNGIWKDHVFIDVWTLVEILQELYFMEKQIEIIIQEALDVSFNECNDRNHENLRKEKP